MFLKDQQFMPPLSLKNSYGSSQFLYIGSDSDEESEHDIDVSAMMDHKHNSTR